MWSRSDKATPEAVSIYANLWEQSLPAVVSLVAPLPETTLIGPCCFRPTTVLVTGVWQDRTD